ncbi:hypothetical protein PROFUN_07221 [Planoprotostelium fungivorum]|uniref:tRNA (uracil-O(2)-)-methyltransferase n=1 Tax=Planoprotostelium fungivorum TaxID=1890364 RepID=A0A2P6NMG7_9EUKA|nr:hypothetical protein PROFUN_07221 [Planoprotostelium fungivorum]
MSTRELTSILETCQDVSKSILLAELEVDTERELFWQRKWTLTPTHMFPSVRKFNIKSKICYDEDGNVLFQTDFPMVRVDALPTQDTNNKAHGIVPGDHLMEDLWEIEDTAWEHEHTSYVVYERSLTPRRADLDNVLEEKVIFDRKSGTTTFLPISHGGMSEKLPSCYPRVDRLYIQYAPGRVKVKAVPLDPDNLGNMKRYGDILVEKVKKWGRGGYVRKAKHDIMIPRSLYVDNYVRMKKSYGHIAEDWEEVTDPIKYVYEDISICAFLISIWQMERTMDASLRKQTFVDLGCGNGLLVHLLTLEGYHGYGIDLVSRKIWDKFKGADLRTEQFRPDLASFPQVDWILGNHSDELTPWIPYIASLSPNTKYFVLPCCFYDFSGKYAVSGGTLGKYQTYLNYVEQIGSEVSSIQKESESLTQRQCGFRVEHETLQIPSTKNQAQIGRLRNYDVNDPAQVQEVEARRAKLMSRFTGFVIRPPQPTCTPQKRYRGAELEAHLKSLGITKPPRTKNQQPREIKT